MQWQDVHGRPVIKVGSTWSLQKQDSEQQSRTESQELKLTPQEQEKYSTFAIMAKEKIADGIKKSLDTDLNPAQKDGEDQKRHFAPYAALSDDQLSSIYAYCTKWDLNMNSLLRFGKIKSTFDQRSNKDIPSEIPIKKAIADLTSALKSLPAAPEGVYSRALTGWARKEDSNGKRIGSGRKASPFIEQLQALEPGDTLEDPGFGSFTSEGSLVLDRFLTGANDSDENIILEVKSAGMKDISPISKFTFEKEHMLEPGAKFKVTGKRTGFSKRVGKHTVIELEHLPE